MTLDHKVALRLQFLRRVANKVCKHLLSTDARLFANAFTVQRAQALENDPDLSERVEAFVGRFGRLQDTVGDKLLPTLLIALGESPSAVIDNLDRAERIGLIHSADEWMAMRQLRNLMVHEYVEDLTVLVSALESGHQFVATLVAATHKMNAEIERRGWV